MLVSFFTSFDNKNEQCWIHADFIFTSIDNKNERYWFHVEFMLISFLLVLITKMNGAECMLNSCWFHVGFIFTSFDNKNERCWIHVDFMLISYAERLGFVYWGYSFSFLHVLDLMCHVNFVQQRFVFLVFSFLLFFVVACLFVKIWLCYYRQTVARQTGIWSNLSSFPSSKLAGTMPYHSWFLWEIWRSWAIC